MEGTAIKELVEEKVNVSQDDIHKKVKGLTRHIDEKISEIYKEHLTKYELIGPEEKYKTLIDYAAHFIPDL